MVASANVEDFKSRLIKRRGELSTRLRSIEEDLGTFLSDEEDRDFEREDDDVQEELGQQGLAEVRAIDAALQRIEDGRFGICARCGQPISSRRLDAVPHAALCMNCVAEIGGETRDG
jgi:RNA polymerase-binding transcription factor DksA